MPSKKKGPAEQKSKKKLAEEKAIRAADQTFGIKNKGKSAKAKQHVARVKQSLLGNDEAARDKRQEEKKLRRAQKEAEEREERALFSETTDIMKVKKTSAKEAKPAPSPDEALAVQRALERAKELFDQGAMTMQEYVDYKEQILADSSDDDEDDDATDATDEGDSSVDGDDDDEGDDREESEPEPEPDPRLSLKLVDLYLEGALPDDIDINLGDLPDDDADE